VWSVKYTVEFRAWFDSLTDEDEIASIRAAVRVLRDEGPTLPRPLADRVKASQYHNMKELRPVGTTIRILFIFDPLRTAILLTGGDKEGQWEEWYAENIPLADRLYAAHLQAIEPEVTARRQADRAARGGKKGRKR
jgi:hypothetical protein